MTVWSFTGPAPNPLAELSDDAVTVTAATPTVQEIHQIALHLLCAAFDRSLPCGDYPKPTGVDWPLPSGRGTGHEEGSDERDERDQSLDDALRLVRLDVESADGSIIAAAMDLSRTSPLVVDGEPGGSDRRECGWEVIGARPGQAKRGPCGSPLHRSVFSCRALDTTGPWTVQGRETTIAGGLAAGAKTLLALSLSLPAERTDLLSGPDSPVIPERSRACSGADACQPRSAPGRRPPCRREQHCKNHLLFSR
jgi:hypothetical protein